MKKYIDYLFWKRTWFRVIFVMLPIIPFSLIVLLVFNGIDRETADGLAIALAVALLVLAILDNDDVDCPLNPFKK